MDLADSCGEKEDEKHRHTSRPLFARAQTLRDRPTRPQLLSNSSGQVGRRLNYVILTDPDPMMSICTCTCTSTSTDTEMLTLLLSTSRLQS